MNTSAHTPGPWFWALDADNQPTSLRQSGSGDTVIHPQAEQSDYGLSSHEWNDVSEADARLIAAAPDLLEALKALVNNYEGVCGNLPFGMMGRSQIAEDPAPARAAIAKAEGRS